MIVMTRYPGRWGTDHLLDLADQFVTRLTRPLADQANHHNHLRHVRAGGFEAHSSPPGDAPEGRYR